MSATSNEIGSISDVTVAQLDSIPTEYILAISDVLRGIANGISPVLSVLVDVNRFLVRNNVGESETGLIVGFLLFTWSADRSSDSHRGEPRAEQDRFCNQILPRSGSFARESSLSDKPYKTMTYIGNR